MSDPMRDLDHYERRILSDVDEYGFFHCTVFDPKEINPLFTYSVGFTKTLSCPEFIVFGLDEKLHSAMLWEAFHQIRDGRQPEDNQRWSNMIEGYDCISRKVHPTNVVRDYLNSAMWFWNVWTKHDTPLEAYQLVWPSNGPGLFPWEEGCAKLVSDHQPPLYLPNRALS